MATMKDSLAISRDGGNYVYAMEQEDVILSQREQPRLWLQQRVLRDGFGQNVYVDMPKDIEDRPICILDSGAGSAAWILDCLDQFPAATTTVEFYGVDPDPRLFPPLTEVTRNRIKLLKGTVQDLTSDHAEWVDYFDIVNQRLLLAALSVEGWKTAAEQIFAVLRSGGWAQFLEVGFVTVKDPQTGAIVRTDQEDNQTSTATGRFQALLQKIFKGNGLVSDCFDHIEGNLKAAGFVNTSRRERAFELWGEPSTSASEKTTGGDARENWIGAWSALRDTALRLKLVSSRDEFESMIGAVKEEWKNPACEAKYHVFIIIGQKP